MPGGFNLGLLMRAPLGAGTPSGLQDFGGRAAAAVLDPIRLARELLTESHQLVVSFGVAPFESLTFAVTLCRNRNRDLYHGLLDCIRSEHCLAATRCMP
jgi:hypothetical protein